VCAICGINADIALAEYREKRAAFQKKQNADMQWDKDEHGKITGAMRYGYRAQPDIDALKKEYKERGWPVNDAVHCYRWWDVDHILPVSEGGGPDDYPRDKDYLENLRTLCVPCHKKETRALRARLKEKKNEQKQLQKEKS
jgi:5-methylcytosine-specific restriction endonuclease McrA